MIERLREEMLGNPRFRWGLALIVALLALYAILVLRDSARNARATAVAPQARIAALAGSAGEGEQWRAQADRLRGLLAEYDTYVWHDVTKAQAQAALQDRVGEMLARAGLRATELNAGGGIDATAATPRAAATNPGTDPVRIRARVVFEYQRPALATFVRGLADGTRRIGVERLALRTMPAPVMEIELFALYRPPGGAGR